MHTISASIKAEALRIGFTDCGFSKAGAVTDDAARLKEWLDNRRHAGMQYMENHFEKRTDPSKLVEGARSVISVTLNYYTDKTQADPEAPVISKYAYGKDYHYVMKEKLRLLLSWINDQFGRVNGRVFVDSAPVLDRAWARRAGLGWIGKNSNLISRNHGSFVFIGEIILDLELDYNPIPEIDYCGSCNICLEACPTGAILENRTIDAALCISYQTIENKEEIPAELRPGFRNRLFGCDICQDVCPWNHKAVVHSVPEFEPSEDLLNFNRSQLTSLEKRDYNRLFKNSAVKRVKYDKLVGNIMYLLDQS